MKWIVSNIKHGIVQTLAQLLAVGCLCLFYGQSATAAIHACTLADGSVTFQDTACPLVRKAEKKTAKVSGRIPFGIEKTWFDTPTVVPDGAVCTEAGCHCGMYSREYKTGLPLAIADALYLDGSWHRLESTLEQLELPDKNSNERADLRRERDEAACNILMSQKTLRLFGRNVLRDLRDKKRWAEDRGLDDPEACDSGDMRVCEHTDLIALYNRIQSDIKALSAIPRVEDDADQATANKENMSN